MLEDTRDGDLLLRVKVQPRAKRTEIAGIHDAQLKVRLATPPVDGKANRALCRFIARSLGLRPAQVQLVRGQTSRSKVLRLAGVAREDAESALSAP